MSLANRSGYILERLKLYVLAFAAILVVNFAIPRLMPGDPTTQFVGPGFTEETRQQMLEEFGFNRPIWEQFIAYIINTFTGNFGISISNYPRPVMDLIVERLPRTLFLMFTSITVSILIGVPLGAIAAWKFGSKTDLSITQITLFFRSIPSFWLGILLIFIFGFHLDIFPIQGVASMDVSQSNTIEYYTSFLWHSILPVITLAVYFLAGYTFLMRGSLLDILPENYITIAESKGLSDRRVLFRHGVHPAFPPVLTQLGFQIGRLVGGAILVETVFSYPGMGQLMFNAVLARDYPVLQAAFFFLTLTVLIAMFISEILYVVLDPRVADED